MTGYTAFVGHNRLATGTLAEVALAVHATEGDGPMPVVFDDATGNVVDIDIRGSAQDVLARLAPPKRGRGRPSMGVVAREVTLLPRHWEWLGEQPGGASVTLRRLVDAERRKGTSERRAARDATYRFMGAMAGNLPGFEAAARALYAGDGEGFATIIAAWPADIVAQIDVMLRREG